MPGGRASDEPDAELEDEPVEPVVVPVVAQPERRAATQPAAVAAFIRITDIPLARSTSRGGHYITRRPRLKGWFPDNKVLPLFALPAREPRMDCSLVETLDRDLLVARRRPLRLPHRALGQAQFAGQE